MLVAGPRARHPEAKLDLCYVTDDIIVTSGPAISYPSRAYRNPLPRLVSFLTSRHNEEWCIFEFRAEGTGYEDKAVKGRIRHFPWPDHHPPPFGIMPKLIAEMTLWMGEEAGRKDFPVVENGDGKLGHLGLHKDKDQKVEVKKVAILHCKAGKGRSGTVACSYLISVRGWKVEDALKRFTERRMRPGWGDGVSIKSQRRWITYVDRWGKHGKKYTENKVRIVEVRLWGRREGVNVLIRGFIEDGKKIKVLHTWKNTDGEDIKIPEEHTEEEDHQVEQKFEQSAANGLQKNDVKSPTRTEPSQSKDHESASSGTSTPNSSSTTGLKPAITNPPPSIITILRPVEPLIIDTQDINVEVEKRNKSSYGIPSVTTSTAHSWFNAFFEGQGPEQNGNPARTGTYTIDWDAMDGLKGSSRRGVRAVEKVAVVWEILDENTTSKENKKPEQVKQNSGKEQEKVKSQEDIVQGDPGGESDVEEGIQSFGMKGEKV